MNNSENREEFLASIQASKDVRTIFEKLTLNLDKKTRNLIESCYASQELQSIYNGLRAEAELNTSKSSKKPMFLFPNAYVYQFLNDLFTPYYGEDWLTDKNKVMKLVKTEPLLAPWFVGKKLRRKK